MAFKCSWCGSADTMAAFDLCQCLACGNHTTFEGEKAVPASMVTEGITVKDVERAEAKGV